MGATTPDYGLKFFKSGKPWKGSTSPGERGLRKDLVTEPLVYLPSPNQLPPLMDDAGQHDALKNQ